MVQVCTVSCLLGDVQDLFNIKLQPGHAAAFATDCDLPATHEMVRSIGMQVDFYILYSPMGGKKVFASSQFLLFLVVFHRFQVIQLQSE